MDRQQFLPVEVGMIAHTLGSTLRLHLIHDTDCQPWSVGFCGRVVKSLSDLHLDYLGPTALCRKCFARTGAAFYLPADRYVIIEFFDQSVIPYV